MEKKYNVFLYVQNRKFVGTNGKRKTVQESGSVRISFGQDLYRCLFQTDTNAKMLPYLRSLLVVIFYSKYCMFS